ncbi:MAG TPA: hypothetical protein VFG25_01635 [Nitrosopumilaceae archaeon]|nr:hypothetical protein [Nitrosopumilaceae archaeon]
MALQSKMTVYAAIAGVLALMGGIIFYGSLDVPEIETTQIELQSVEVVEVNTIENRAKLEVVFLIKNPGDKTFTVPLISYDLFANGKHVGVGQYSTEDIAMPGRAAFYPNSEIPLTNFFNLVKTEANSDIYQMIVDGNDIQYSVEGNITVETAWALIEKDFQSSL